jgi:hypothetical protein
VPALEFFERLERFHAISDGHHFESGIGEMPVGRVEKYLVALDEQLTLRSVDSGNGSGAAPCRRRIISAS